MTLMSCSSLCYSGVCILGHFLVLMIFTVFLPHRNNVYILGENNSNVPKILEIIAEVILHKTLSNDQHVLSRLLAIVRHVQVLPVTHSLSVLLIVIDMHNEVWYKSLLLSPVKIKMIMIVPGHGDTATKHFYKTRSPFRFFLKLLMGS